MQRMRTKYFVMLLSAVILSCSATQSGVKHPLPQDTIRKAEQRVENIPDESLTPKESKAKEEVVETLRQSSKAVSQTSRTTDKGLIEAITKSNEMVADLYNESIEARKKNDSLEAQNRSLELLINRQFKTLDNIDKTITDEAKAGRALMSSFRVIPAILGAILLILVFIAGALWIQQQRLKKEKKNLITKNE